MNTLQQKQKEYIKLLEKNFTNLYKCNGAPVLDGEEQRSEIAKLEAEANKEDKPLLQWVNKEIEKYNKLASVKAEISIYYAAKAVAFEEVKQKIESL